MKKTGINLINLLLKKKNNERIKKFGFSYKNTYLVGDWCDLKDNFYKNVKNFSPLNFFKVKNYKKKKLRFINNFKKLSSMFIFFRKKTKSYS